MSNLVILRGLVREKRHWGTFPEKLSKEIEGLNIITPEIQGVGEFANIVSPNNFDEMIHFMRGQIKNQLEGSENYIAAISLGGMIAKRWTELYPADFKKMILINTSFKGINPLISRVRPSAIKEFLKIFISSSIEKREELIVKLVSNTSSKYEYITKEWIKIQEDASVQKKSFINQIRAAITFNPSREKPLPELMILAGKKDRLCNYKSSITLHELWGGEIYLHEEAGHDIPIDAREWLIEHISKFIKA